MSDTQFPTDFTKLTAAPGVKVLADDGTTAGFVDVGDLLDAGAATAPLGGDLEGVIGNAEVRSIAGVAIVTAGAVAGDNLVYDGEKFVPEPDPNTLDAGYF